MGLNNIKWKNSQKFFILKYLWFDQIEKKLRKKEKKKIGRRDFNKIKLNKNV